MSEPTPATRNDLGQWKPGTSGNPKGRPSRQHELETLESIRASFPPERVTAILEDALRIAEETNSARGMLAVVTEILDRTQGKSVARVAQPSNGLQEILDMLNASGK